MSVRLIIIQGRETVARVEDYDGPIPRTGEYLFHPLVDMDVDDGEAPATAVELTAAEALVLANRLTRAAQLILESAEDRPDVEREAARYTVPDDISPIEQEPGLPGDAPGAGQ